MRSFFDPKAYMEAGENGTIRLTSPFAKPVSNDQVRMLESGDLTFFVMFRLSYTSLGKPHTVQICTYAVPNSNEMLGCTKWNESY
jgi:hypothetical protein